MPEITIKARLRPILASTRLVADLDAIVASAGQKESRWKCTGLSENEVTRISNHAGVYCFTLPESALPAERTLVLHGRTFGSKDSKAQLQIRFDYAPRKFGNHEDFVVYAGKTAGIRARIKGHLSINPRATTNQVLRGLTGGSHLNVNEKVLAVALQKMKAHARVHYFEHFHPSEAIDIRARNDAGECFVAERDLLEIKLIATFAPPFNIKAER